MSTKEKQTVRLLDQKLDDRTAHTLMIAALIVLISVLIHDGDHIRQAILWSTDTSGKWVTQAYLDTHFGGDMTIWNVLTPSILVLNLTVYIFPVLSIFLIKMKRFSSMLVLSIAGIFTTCSFMILHLFGSFSGNWGFWNISYIALSKSDALQTVGYRIGALSWVLLIEVPVLCIPVSVKAFKMYRAEKARILAETESK